MTVKDIKIEEEIFRPKVPSPSVKSTRCKTKPLRKYLIEIPRELIMKYYDIKLCMDTMYVTECGMVIAIDQTDHHVPKFGSN